MGYDHRLGDAWAGNLNIVDNCLMFIRNYKRVLADPNATFKDSTKARFMLPKQIAVYLDAVRAVSEYEEQMDAIGMRYEREEEL